MERSLTLIALMLALAPSAAAQSCPASAGSASTCFNGGAGNAVTPISTGGNALCFSAAFNCSALASPQLQSMMGSVMGAGYTVLAPNCTGATTIYSYIPTTISCSVFASSFPALGGTVLSICGTANCNAPPAAPPLSRLPPPLASPPTPPPAAVCPSAGGASSCMFGGAGAPVVASPVPGGGGYCASATFVCATLASPMVTSLIQATGFSAAINCTAVTSNTTTIYFSLPKGMVCSTVVTGLVGIGAQSVAVCAQSNCNSGTFVPPAAVTTPSPSSAARFFGTWGPAPRAALVAAAAMIALLGTSS